MPVSGLRKNSDGHFARDGVASERELLLKAAVDAGLQPSSVYELAVALTGRMWEHTGSREVRMIGWELLDAAHRAARGPGVRGHRCNA